MGKLAFLDRILETVEKIFGRSARTVFLLAAVVWVPLGGFCWFVIGNWLNLTTLSSTQERLDLANQRASTAEMMSTAASQARLALHEQKAKLEEENSTLKTQLQSYQKADDIRKKNAALQKQTAKRPTKIPILSDLFAEDEFYIMGHNRRILIMDRRYTIIASPSLGGLLSGRGCTLTVANVDTDGEEKFEFVEGKSGFLSVGEAKVLLILVSAQSFGPRSDVCVFQQRQ